MRLILNKLRRASVLAGLLFTAACSTDRTATASLEPSAPNLAKNTRLAKPTGDAALDSTGTQTLNVLKVLGRKTPLSESITASATIGPAGGTIRIPDLGFSLYVPMGALSKSTKISVTAMAGSGVAYHFEPHGLQFNYPVWFTQETKFTESTSGLLLQGAYFKDDKQVDNHSKKATVDEIYQVDLDPLGLILFGIKHFSGYLVSCA